MLAAIFVLASLTTIITTNAQDIPIGCQREGDMALTFDQGPGQYTGRLLAILQKQKVKASFHVTTEYLDNPVILAYLKRTVTDGHLLGLALKANKGDPEDSLIKQLQEQVDRARQALKRHVPQASVSFARLPSDVHVTPGIQNALRQKGLQLTGYNLDSQDYLFANDTGVNTDPPTGSVSAVIKGLLAAIDGAVKGSFIVVQRDLIGPSVTQTEAIIKEAKERGYRLVKLDECVMMSGVGTSGSEKPVSPDPNVKQQASSGDCNMAGKTLRFLPAAVAFICLLI